MKKILINSLICSALAVAPAFANTEKMFENTQSKEWNSTPKNVREALTNIKVMSGSSAKDMMSTNWLNELKRSPGTYGLNSNDVDWVNGMLSANGNKKTWSTKTKVNVANKKNENTNISKNIIKKEVQSKTPEKEMLIAQDNIKKESKKTSAISTPLPVAPKDFASVKSQDLTPVREQDKTENNIAKVNAKPVSKPEVKNNKSEVEVNHNLLKISDALISVYNEEKSKSASEDLATLKIVEETIRIEELNRLTIEEQNKKLNTVDSLINEYQNTVNINNEVEGVEKLTEIVKRSSEEAEKINDKLEAENNDLLLQKKNDLENKERVESETVKIVNKTTDYAISMSKLKSDLMKKNKEKAESMIDEITISIGKAVEAEKNTKNLNWKEKLLIILSGFFVVIAGLFPFVSKKGEK